MSRLKKLRGRSIAELADRGRQKTAAIAERLGVSSETRMPSDDTILRFLDNAADVDGVRKRFKDGPNRFYPIFNCRENSVSEFKTRFPDEVYKIVDQADRILAGKFDLLGYTGLDFGGPLPDWHLEPLSGTRSPLRHWSTIGETDPTETGDKKVVWELNRHQHFSLLGRAYWLTGNEKYADVFVEHVKDWIERNPPKFGLNWMSSLEIAYRSISWIWGIHFFLRSDRLTAPLFLRMLKVLYLNGRHIERHLSTYTSPNTHLTGEALGLYVIGSIFGEAEEAVRWKETGYRILLDALEYQIRDDGGYVEQATQYHRYTADIYLSLLILRHEASASISATHEQKLRTMLEFLMHLAQPDGKTPLIGDDDGGRLHFFDDRPPADFRATLAVGAVLLNDGPLKFAAGEATAELFWLLGPDGLAAFNRIGPIVPKESVKALHDSGFYVIRDGWTADSNFVLIDAGPHGFLNGGHAHGDALSFVLSAGGVPVFIDSGTFTYTTDEAARNYFRSTLAHNCLIVNRQSSCEFGGPFSWRSAATTDVTLWEVDGETSRFRGTHDGYRRFDVAYEREFIFGPPGQFTLVDRIKTRSANRFEVSFILSPDVAAEVRDNCSVVIRTKDGSRELLTIVTKMIEERGGEICGWRIEPARTSPRYGAVAMSSRIYFELSRGSDFAVENRFIYA
ncbi:MAG: alginate lyase family protein [Pyrinomonadaceae bacterium]